MANAFSKEEIVFFEQVLAGFDPNNITARQVDKFKPPSTQFERSALTVHRPVPYITLGTEGLTLAGAAFADRTQLTVPSTLNANVGAPSDIKNIPFKMNAVDKFREESKENPPPLDVIQGRDLNVITAHICEVMEKEEVSRSMLAERMGVPVSSVDMFLSGDKNFTLRTLTEMAYVLGKDVEIRLGGSLDTAYSAAQRAEQRKNYDFFLKQQKIIDPLLAGKWFVIWDQKLQAVFDTMIDGVKYGRDNHIYGEFIVQENTDDVKVVRIRSQFAKGEAIRE